MALFKRKDKDTKKGGETTIGKIIYGFLLFMPLLSIGARCLYVIFNKNAYQSYYASEVNAEQYVNVGNNFNYGTRYMMTCGLVPYTEPQNEVVFSVSEFKSNFLNDTQNESINIIRVRSQNNATFCLFYNNTTYVSDRGFADNNVYQFSFVFLNKNSTNLLPQYQTVYEIVYSNDGYLDNAFEYSINETQKSNLYNWAKETGTYTVLYNTTTGLGITNEFIPMLMAYWLIVSVIYFLFDIALILIWAVHKKIHELQESI